ncbi:fork head domain-containing protein [Colletotrichum orchidophilum]|uniref:Fork head domain-containing protein n=1 Tax=Colletotrichum orchidophilum TaxID=1209926 RepID=A0A1G4AQH1_9PEZI|nr:fork head domain-containing protein [Colletotrichum orchidophilum]OHE91420.1 fork head domain-containing protein [Colletotrichum orchidophilum]
MDFNSPTSLMSPGINAATSPRKAQHPVSHQGNGEPVSPNADLVADESSTTTKINLDEGGRQMTYAKLIHLALRDKDSGQMTLGELYGWFVENTERATDENHRWKSSVRSNLSLNQVRQWLPEHRQPKGIWLTLEKQAFERQEGKGSLWRLAAAGSADVQLKRKPRAIRKKKAKAPAASPALSQSGLCDVWQANATGIHHGHNSPRSRDDSAGFSEGSQPAGGTSFNNPTPSLIDLPRGPSKSLKHSIDHKDAGDVVTKRPRTQAIPIDYTGDHQGRALADYLMLSDLSQTSISIKDDPLLYAQFEIQDLTTPPEAYSDLMQLLLSNTASEFRPVYTTERLAIKYSRHGLNSVLDDNFDFQASQYSIMATLSSSVDLWEDPVRYEDGFRIVTYHMLFHAAKSIINVSDACGLLINWKLLDFTATRRPAEPLRSAAATKKTTRPCRPLLHRPQLATPQSKDLSDVYYEKDDKIVFIGGRAILDTSDEAAKSVETDSPVTDANTTDSSSSDEYDKVKPKDIMVS